MIGSYTGDKINIVKYTYDKWGGMTEAVTRNVDAYIEDYNKLVKNQNGKEVMGNSIIFVDESVDVEYNDRIELVSRLGENIENYGKKYDIIKLYKGHGFEKMQWEIII